MSEIDSLVHIVVIILIFIALIRLNSWMKRMENNDKKLEAIINSDRSIMLIAFERLTAFSDTVNEELAKKISGFKELRHRLLNPLPPGSWDFAEKTSVRKEAIILEIRYGHVEFLPVSEQEELDQGRISSDVIQLPLLHFLGMYEPTDL